jgi:leucyl aminopeptidase
MNGKTSEIISTDAEGRLILSDALCYAARYKPKAVIDIATLTGACKVALGPHIAGVASNDPALAERWLAGAPRAGGGGLGRPPPPPARGGGGRGRWGGAAPPAPARAT